MPLVNKTKERATVRLPNNGAILGQMALPRHGVARIDDTYGTPWLELMTLDTFGNPTYFRIKGIRTLQLLQRSLLAHHLKCHRTDVIIFERGIDVLDDGTVVSYVSQSGASGSVQMFRMPPLTADGDGPLYPVPGCKGDHFALTGLFDIRVVLDMLTAWLDQEVLEIVDDLPDDFPYEDAYARIGVIGVADNTQREEGV